MNSIISLAVRSLYSLVAIFFFVFTVQPVVAAENYDRQIESIDRYVKGGELFVLSLNGLPDDNPGVQKKILNIKDRYGNNLVGKLVAIQDIDRILEAFRVVGIGAFRAENNAGLNVVEANYAGIKRIFEADVKVVPQEKISLLNELKEKLKPVIFESVEKQIQGYVALKQRAESLQKITAQPGIWEKMDIIASLVVCLDPERMSPLRLEEIRDVYFYKTLSETDMGLNVLRSYRTREGKTFYNYFSEQQDVNYDLLHILIEPFFDNHNIPTSSEIDIKQLDKSLSMFLERGLAADKLKAFCETYKNSEGRNIVSLAINDPWFLKTMKNAGVEVFAMLTKKDESGDDALSFSKLEPWQYYVMDEEGEKIRSELERREKAKEMRRAEEESRAIEEREQKFLNRINALNEKPFDVLFWGHLVSEFSVDDTLMDNHGFARIGLMAVFLQKTNSLRSVFLQQNLDDSGVQTQANQLWKSFLAKYDELSHQGEAGGYGKDMLASPIRVLDILKYDILPMYDSDLPFVETMQTLQSNILAMGGTFGMNFSRKANEDEARIMIDSLEQFGSSIFNPRNEVFTETFKESISVLESKIKGKKDEEMSAIISDFIKAHNPAFDAIVTEKNAWEHIQNYIVKPFRVKIAKEIIDRLFVKPSTPLTTDQKLKLEDHQTNCAVIALSSVFKVGSSGIQFDQIDDVLSNRPSMKGKDGSYYKNSNQRYDDVMKMKTKITSMEGDDDE